MSKIIPFPARNCRYLLLGRCSNHFWLIMQAHGKPGLKDYRCMLWEHKLNEIDAHWNSLERKQRFGKDTPKSGDAGRKSDQTQASSQIACDDFKLEPDGSLTKCAYYYNETCLLKFPECGSICDDYVPSGVQT